MICLSIGKILYIRTFSLQELLLPSSPCPLSGRRKGRARGPVNGDSMSCLVWGFDEFDSPRGFDTVEELQEYINEEIEASGNPDVE